MLATVLLTVCAVAGMWGIGVFGGSSAPNGKPAPCNEPRADDSPEYPALCAALNRPDLPVLLGMPDGHASAAQSGGGPVTFADGTRADDASARKQIGAVCGRLSHDPHSSVDGLSFLPGGLVARRATVLGLTAATSSDGTVALVAGGAEPRNRPGGVAPTLSSRRTPTPAATGRSRSPSGGRTTSRRTPRCCSGSPSRSCRPSLAGAPGRRAPGRRAPGRRA